MLPDCRELERLSRCLESWRATCQQEMLLGNPVRARHIAMSMCVCIGMLHLAYLVAGFCDSISWPLLVDLSRIDSCQGKQWLPHSQHQSAESAHKLQTCMPLGGQGSLHHNNTRQVASYFHSEHSLHTIVAAPDRFSAS